MAFPVMNPNAFAQLNQSERTAIEQSVFLCSIKKSLIVGDIRPENVNPSIQKMLDLGLYMLDTWGHLCVTPSAYQAIIKEQSRAK